MGDFLGKAYENLSKGKLKHGSVITHLNSLLGWPQCRLLPKGFNQPLGPVGRKATGKKAQEREDGIRG